VSTHARALSLALFLSLISSKRDSLCANKIKCPTQLSPEACEQPPGQNSRKVSCIVIIYAKLSSEQILRNFYLLLLERNFLEQLRCSNLSYILYVVCVCLCCVCVCTLI